MKCTKAMPLTDVEHRVLCLQLHNNTAAFNLALLARDGRVDLVHIPRICSRVWSTISELHIIIPDLPLTDIDDRVSLAQADHNLP